VGQVWVEGISWRTAPWPSPYVMSWMIERCVGVMVFSLNSDQTFGSGLSLSKEDLRGRSGAEEMKTLASCGMREVW